MATLEFHTSPDGRVYYSEDGGEQKRLTKFSSDVYPLLNMIEERFPECYARLAMIYRAGARTSKEIDDKTYRMLERFVRCNFGEHDLLSRDIDGLILNFEEVRCPLRGGFCPDENVICKPKGIIKLSAEEKRVADMYISGYTCYEIARELNKQVNTIKVQLFRIKNKLGVKRAREIIKILKMHNL